MRLLLDTHVALWAIADSPRLSETARRLISDPENQVIVSAATIWEISIKHALARGKHALWRGGPNAMPISGGQAATKGQPTRSASASRAGG